MPAASAVCFIACSCSLSRFWASLTTPRYVSNSLRPSSIFWSSSAIAFWLVSASLSAVCVGSAARFGGPDSGLPGCPLLACRLAGLTLAGLALAGRSPLLAWSLPASPLLAWSLPASPLLAWFLPASPLLAWSSGFARWLGGLRLGLVVAGFGRRLVARRPVPGSLRGSSSRG